MMSHSDIEQVRGESGRFGTNPNWSDPGIPCGNSPPLPWWPVWLAALGWVTWIGFLIAMVVSVLRTPPA